MKHCRPDQPVDRDHEDELERLRAMAAHNRVAVAHALHHCASEQICAPPWLISAADCMLTDLLKKEVSTKRGRAAGYVARHRQDLVDLERWDTVHYVRRLKRQNADDLKRLKIHRRRQDWSDDDERIFGQHIEKTHLWLKHGVLECASMMLRGGAAYAGVHGVRRSYRLVERSMKSPGSRFRYHLTFGDFLKQLGLEYGAKKAGTKFVPLYDLTP